MAKQNSKNMPDKALDQEDTLAIVARHHDYWQQGDLEGVMSLYHSDIRYFDYFSNTEINREELRDYLSISLPVHNQVKLQHTDRIRVDGDTAFIQYNYSITGANNKVHHFCSSEAITVKAGKIIRINEYSSLIRSQEELESNQRGKIGLDDSRLHILLQDINDYFEKNQPYLDSALNLAQVAVSTGYTRNQISYALNHGLQKSFYEYVNLARVQHLLKNLEFSLNSNITDAALQVGFNSTSTFYKFFKQHTGLTPRAYIKKMSINNA